MEPVEMLMNEHRRIEKTLDALDGFAEKCLREETWDGRAELKKFVEFIRGFADRCHHGKEEKILFEEMIGSGFPREAGPLAVMTAEHEEGRRHVGILKELAEQPGPWSAEDRSKLSRAASGYTGLLRQHIQKEDHVLYPMAAGQLSGETWKRIEKRFSEFEQKEMGHGEHERLHKLGEELAGK